MMSITVKRKSFLFSDEIGSVNINDNEKEQVAKPWNSVRRGNKKQCITKCVKQINFFYTFCKQPIFL